MYFKACRSFLILLSVTQPLKCHFTDSLNTHKKSSLRSKRFQSSYFAKVRAEAKKGLSFIFFCSCPRFLDEPREETLATQAKKKVSQWSVVKEKKYNWVRKVAWKNSRHFATVTGHFAPMSFRPHYLVPYFRTTTIIFEVCLFWFMLKER